MSTQNVGPSHYSLFAKSILETIHQVDRAILYGVEPLTEREKILSSEQMQSMVAQAKEALSQPQTLTNQLATLLVDLYAGEASLGQICALFDQMDKDLFQSLCRLVWEVKGSPSDDLKYGEDQIRANPQLLLTIVNSEGDNPMEMLIRGQGGSLEDLKQILSSKSFSIPEQSSDQIVNKKMLVESYYQQLAKKITDSKDVLDFKFFTGDENLAFEIAKIDAAQSEWEFSSNIQMYGIKNPDLLFEIAKIAAAYRNSHISMNLQNYGIEDPDRLFAILKIAAAQNGENVSKHIKNCGIEDPDRLFAILKIAAAQDGEGVSKYIKNWKIKDPERWFVIAQIAIAQNGTFMFNLVDNYLLEESKYIVCKYLCLLNMLIKDDISPQARIFLNKDRENIQGIKEITDSEARIKELQKLMTKMSITHGEKKVQGIKEFQDSKDEADRLQRIMPQRLILYRVKEAFFADKGKKLLEGKNPLEGKKLLEDLEKTFKLVREYRNSALAGSLTRLLCEEMSSDSYYACYKRLVGNKDYLRIPMIFLAKWAPDLTQSEAIKTLLISLRGLLRNEVTNFLQTWLQALLVMDQSPLSSNSKCNLIAQASQYPEISSPAVAEDFRKRLRFIQALCAQGQVAYLDRKFKDDMTKDLRDLFIEKLQEDPFINLRGIQDLSKKYMKTLDALRQPLAWKVYEGKIQTLRDPLVQAQFQRFIVSVLEDTFLTERYRTEISPHLKCLHEKCPEILVKWKAPQVSIVINPSQMEPSESRPNGFLAFFKEKQEDKHFQIDGKEQFPIFTAFLKKTLAKQENALADLKLRPQGASKEADPDCKTELLMKLCLTKKGSPLPLLIKLYEELQKIPNLELANDIKGLIEGFEAPPAKSTLNIIDTDDWQDLFLSGTEVSGSCQRVDGAPSLNKCLLAYVMDGKNRMLAVKDAFGKIVARSMFRLLWDDKNKKPILFQDRIYPSLCSKELVSALNWHAEKRAKELGCPLVTVNRDRKEMSDYRGTALSLGSACPYEYEDAAEGIKNKGVFTIHGLKQVKLS